MSLPVRLAQVLVNAAWRATHRQSKAIGHRGSGTTPGSGGWFNLVREPFTGAWQRNVEWRTDQVLTYSAVFRCISLISSDVAKMRMRLVQQDDHRIWQETTNPAFSPVLRKPNRYQTRIQFFLNWMQSKLVHGNTYVLKVRDARSVVVSLHVLDPQLVNVFVAPDGSVFYELLTDNLAGIRDRVMVPASEIIHDVMPSMFSHPLVGVSPITACGLAATQGLKIQHTQTKFFANGSNPGGVLTAPGHINDDTARRVKEYWSQKYGAGGTDVGMVAVLGDGLKYEPMMMTATDAQLIEQLKFTAETVATAFGVPAYMIGVGSPPTYNNIEALNAQYYAQCLQIHIESIEEGLDDGLGLGPRFGNSYGTEFDLEDLLRMDTATQMKVASDGVRAGILKPDEARSKFSLVPVPGGDTPYMQEQQWPLRHLAERELPARPVSPPEEIDEDDSGGDGDDQENADVAEERQRRVVLFADAIKRSAREHGLRRSA